MTRWSLAALGAAFLMLWPGMAGAQGDVLGRPVLTGAFAAPGETAAPGIRAEVVRQEGGSDYVVTLEWTLPPGLHQSLQPEWFGFVVLDGVQGPMVYPPHHKLILDLPSWEGSVAISAPWDTALPPGTPVAVEVFWQLCYDNGLCLRPERHTFMVEIPVAEAPSWNGILLEAGSAAEPAIGGATGGGGGGPATVLLYLALAFLGGLILNFMPCVLPVLSLKALSLAKDASAGEAGPIRALGTGLGVVMSIMALGVAALALQALGTQVGWGFQFQNPWYGATLALVLVGFALSLFDVWTLPVPSRGPRNVRERGKDRQAFWRAMLNGAFMVLLATPCSAPFLGTALGFAFAAPPWLLLLVFLMIGLGLAGPLVLLDLVPGLGRLLPRPGPWMDTFTGLMGLVLGGTAVWLLTVVLAQVDSTTFGLVLWLVLGLVGALWNLGRLQKAARESAWSPRRLLGATLPLVLVVAMLGALMGGLGGNDRGSVGAPGGPPEQTGQASGKAGWAPFASATVMESLESRPVLVAFGADWCLTCQVNEAGVLADPDLLALLDSRGVQRFYGDYTLAKPDIAAWLKAHGRAGVPFYLLAFPGGGGEVLPELLLPGMVEAALDRLSPPEASLD